MEHEKKWGNGVLSPAPAGQLCPIREDLKEYGAIVFRGFEISKDKGTFGQVRKFQAEGICRCQRMTWICYDMFCPSPRILRTYSNLTFASTQFYEKIPRVHPDVSKNARQLPLKNGIGSLFLWWK